MARQLFVGVHVFPQCGKLQTIGSMGEFKISPLLVIVVILIFLVFIAVAPIAIRASSATFTNIIAALFTKHSIHGILVFIYQNGADTRPPITIQTALSRSFAHLHPFALRAAWRVLACARRRRLRFMSILIFGNFNSVAFIGSFPFLAG